MKNYYGLLKANTTVRQIWLPNKKKNKEKEKKNKKATLDGKM